MTELRNTYEAERKGVSSPEEKKDVSGPATGSEHQGTVAVQDEGYRPAPPLKM